MTEDIGIETLQSDIADLEAQIAEYKIVLRNKNASIELSKSELAFCQDATIRLRNAENERDNYKECWKEANNERLGLRIEILKMSDIHSGLQEEIQKANASVAFLHNASKIERHKFELELQRANKIIDALLDARSSNQKQ